MLAFKCYLKVGNLSLVCFKKHCLHAFDMLQLLEWEKSSNSCSIPTFAYHYIFRLSWSLGALTGKILLQFIWFGFLHRLLLCFPSGDHCSEHNYEWRFVQLCNREKRILRLFRSHWNSVEGTPHIPMYSSFCHCLCISIAAAIRSVAMRCPGSVWVDMLEDTCKCPRLVTKCHFHRG